MIGVYYDTIKHKYFDLNLPAEIQSSLILPIQQNQKNNLFCKSQVIFKEPLCLNLMLSLFLNRFSYKFINCFQDHQITVFGRLFY